MFTARNKGRLALAAVAVGVALALSGCASGDPRRLRVRRRRRRARQRSSSVRRRTTRTRSSPRSTPGPRERRLHRRAQVPNRPARRLPARALENGEVDLFPEYTGNLLQYYAPDTTATDG